jgi:type I restriction enzyme, R subunit
MPLEKPDLQHLSAAHGLHWAWHVRARICVEMYNAIIKLRPAWASGPNDDDNGKSCVEKIVMTGSGSDPIY